MKKKIIISMLVILMLFSVFITIVEAKSLELILKSSKETVKVGEEIKITVDWIEGMQAADFYLRYDKEIFEFVKADIDKQYLKDNNGKLQVAWFSTNDKDKTSIEFKFKAISEGNAEFKTQIKGGFATGDLEMPDNYKNGKLNIEVTKANTFYKIFIIIGIIIFVLIIIKIVFSKKQKRKIR